MKERKERPTKRKIVQNAEREMREFMGGNVTVKKQVL